MQPGALGRQERACWKQTETQPLCLRTTSSTERGTGTRAFRGGLMHRERVQDQGWASQKVTSPMAAGIVMGTDVAGQQGPGRLGPSTPWLEDW